MPVPDIEQLSAAWNEFSNYVRVIKNARDYAEAVELLDHLLDLVGDDNNHPLTPLAELLGVLIEHYEITHMPQLGDF